MFYLCCRSQWDSIKNNRYKRNNYDDIYSVSIQKVDLAHLKIGSIIACKIVIKNRFHFSTYSF